MRAKHPKKKNTKQKREKLIVGNWKMYPNSIAEAKKIFMNFKSKRHQNTRITTVICPPFVYLNDLKHLYTGAKIFFGAQDVHWAKEGAYTGEISSEMIKSLRCRFVIVGHSERRAIGETDEMVAKKVKHALKEGLHVILCVGEDERDDSGAFVRFIEEQLHGSLAGIMKNEVKKLVIAYEPVWAIGKGNTAMDPHSIEQMKLIIRKNMIKKFGHDVGESIPILYGGSADSTNAAEIVHEGHVDGLLVGRHSLNPDEFSKIIDEVSKGF